MRKRGLITAAITYTVHEIAINTGNHLTGRYVDKQSTGTHYQELILDVDNKFVYNALFDIGGSYSFAGQWEKKGRIVLLSKTHSLSKDAYDNIARDTILEKKVNSKYKSVHIRYTNDTSYIFNVKVKVNNAYIGTTNSQGLIVIPNKPVNSIEISFFTYNKAFKIKDNSCNKFEIFSNLNSEGYVLNDVPIKKWVVHRNKIISLDGLSKVKTVLVK